MRTSKCPMGKLDNDATVVDNATNCRNDDENGGAVPLSLQGRPTASIGSLPPIFAEHSSVRNIPDIERSAALDRNEEEKRSHGYEDEQDEMSPPPLVKPTVSEVSLPPIFTVSPTSSNITKSANVDRREAEDRSPAGTLKDDRMSPPPQGAPTVSIGSLPPIFTGPDSRNLAVDRNKEELSSETWNHADMPPLSRETPNVTMGSLPHIYAGNSNTGSVNVTSRNASVDGNEAEKRSLNGDRTSRRRLENPSVSHVIHPSTAPPTSSEDDPDNAPTPSFASSNRSAPNNGVRPPAAASTPAAPPSENDLNSHGDVAVVVAERVVDDVGDDLEDQIEDRVRRRAYLIACNVLDEIRQNAVPADRVMDTSSVGPGDASASDVAELQEHPSMLAHEKSTNKKRWSLLVRRRRLQILFGMVAMLVVVVIVLVVLLVTRKDSSPPPLSERCSLCAGGFQSLTPQDQLRTIPVGDPMTATFPTCADLFEYQQRLPSTDSACPVLQSLAFIYDCGCQTVPPRPQNATCTACPAYGAVTTGFQRCIAADTAVAIVGSSLFYLRNCDKLSEAWFQTKKGCNCNTSAIRV